MFNPCKAERQGANACRGIWLPWRMPPHDTSALPDADLPLVSRIIPWPFRVLLVAFGVFAVVMPAWELGRGLWPLNIATPVFAVIIMGAAFVGIHLVMAGLSGWSDVWTYPPGAIVVTRRGWGRQTTQRLTATHVARVEVRWLEEAEGADSQWQVVVVPKLTFSGLGAKAGPGGVFDAGSYGSQDYAERIRRALLDHLGLR